MVILFKRKYVPQCSTGSIQSHQNPEFFFCGKNDKPFIVEINDGQTQLRKKPSWWIQFVHAKLNSN